MALWNAGTLTRDTLICEEGAAAWTPLKDYESTLRSALPPVPPPGYGASTPRPAQQPVVVTTSEDGTKILRMGTLVAALILFFLPWMEVSCAGQKFITQNGVQSVLNKFSPADHLKELGGMAEMHESTRLKGTKDGDFGDEAGYSILAGVALFTVVAALGTGLGRNSRQTCGLLAAIALACLGIQAMIGFPLKSAAAKMMDEAMKNNPARSPGMEAQEEMAKAMFGKMFSVNVDYTPWFYGELVLLGVATALGLSGGGSQRRTGS